MAGIKLTLPNIIQFASIFSPYFIGTFLIFSSMLNADVKAYIWLFFIIIVQFLGGLLRNQFGKPKHSQLNNQSSTCNIFALPTVFSNENLTYFSSSAIFHSFTIMYLTNPLFFYFDKLITELVAYGFIYKQISVNSIKLVDIYDPLNEFVLSIIPKLHDTNIIVLMTCP